MPVSAWVCRSGSQRSASNDNKILESLAQAGVVARPVQGEPPAGPGIILFSEVDSPLLALIQAATRNGRERVLAVADGLDPILESNAWEILRAGASDLVFWHGVSDATAQIAARLDRWHGVDEVLKSPLVQENLIGPGVAWQRLLREVIDVARYTDASVLLLGESGTGKELLARLIHTLDSRTERRNLVVVDCTTIVPELAGSEFFGHERGAFTGATAPRDGAFALAQGGTLFLDEVGELPPSMQAQLLRVVQEHTYKRVGSNNWRHTDFRLICATNRELGREVCEGRFRADLYYRVAAWIFRVPPLRERLEDIVPLAEHFLCEVGPEGKPYELNEALRGFLLQRPYPGNVRELKQLVLRIGKRHVGRGPIPLGDVPEDERPGQRAVRTDWRGDELEGIVRRALLLGAGLRDISQAAAEAAIRIAIGEADGNLQRAAQRLGVTDRALQMRRASERRMAR